MSRAVNESDSAAPVLEVQDLHKHFDMSGEVRAVDGVSFSVPHGEVFGIVGESGSGKSTLGRLILKLLEPTSGTISFRGERIDAIADRVFRRRRRELQVVLQDPLASFDPHWRIRRSLEELARLRPSNGGGSWDIEAAVASVGLDPRIVDRYPSEVSGGQLQRLSIARALAPEPELLVLDEPTSALDVSVRGGILNLLTEKCADAGLTVLLISHDFGAIRAMSDRVAVMYRGRIVELGSSDVILTRPRHPYTRGLLDAHALGTGERARNRVRLSANLRVDEPGYEGCALASRCPFAEARCREPQQLLPLVPGHEVRCWKADALDFGAPAATAAASVETPS
ncbi:MAG TPA: ABC transporter ATP-binding protein [Conexibacter sp.]|nr:ABC transporter ATP-binding protein [Conexibacter sp.]